MVKLKKTGASEGISLQMALIQLRWQQLRQMELDNPPSQAANQENSPLFSQKDTSFEPLYTTA
jgi:hypothetical protein